MRWVLSAVVVSLLAAACTGDGDGGDEGVGPAIVARPTVEEVEGPTPTPVLEGRVTNKYELEIEMCFNTYDFYVEQFDEFQELTTVVDCRRPHDGEVYASHFHQAPAEAPFPGSTEMTRWANVACYDSFEGFVGSPYELSALEIGSIRPVEDTWTDPVGLHREVLCFVYAPGAQLSGPMSASQF